MLATILTIEERKEQSLGMDKLSQEIFPLALKLKKKIDIIQGIMAREGKIIALRERGRIY